jgi:thioredoxin-related protein
MKIPAWIITLALLAVWVPQPMAADKGASRQINWSSYAEADTQGAADRKYFIYFYTDRCPSCMKLKKKTFSDKAVIDYINANYTPIKVNANKDAKLAARFRIQGVPDLRFLNPKGEDIGRWLGYIESKRLLTLLQYIGTDSYEETSYQEFVKRQNAP